MYKKDGRFKKGERRSPETEFKTGQHWRSKKPFWDFDWLFSEYVEKQRSSTEIASEFCVTDATIIYWLRKHKIPRRTVSETRAVKYWGVSGNNNPMWNRKGELNPMWKGGVTPERQKFYQSSEWKSVCSAVWKRDNASCQRCECNRSDNPDIPMHIHHIVSFADKELRCELSNLVLLCETCHRFVHSKKNTEHLFLGEYNDEDQD